MRDREQREKSVVQSRNHRKTDIAPVKQPHYSNLHKAKYHDKNYSDIESVKYDIRQYYLYKIQTIKLTLPLDGQYTMTGYTNKSQSTIKIISQ